MDPEKNVVERQEEAIVIKWTQTMVETMVSLREKYNSLFSGKRGTALNGWMKVAEEMNFKSPTLVWKQLQKKWANLIQKYKELKNPPTGMGTESEDLVATTWTHFEAIDRFMSERHIISPPFLIDSSRKNHQAPSPPTQSDNSFQFQEYMQLEYLTPTSTTNTQIPNAPSINATHSQFKYGTSHSVYLPSTSASPSPNSDSSMSSTSNSPPLQTITVLANKRKCEQQPSSGKSKKGKQEAEEDPMLKYMKDRDEKEFKLAESMLDILKKYFEKKE